MPGSYSHQIKSRKRKEIKPSGLRWCDSMEVCCWGHPQERTGCSAARSAVNWQSSALSNFRFPSESQVAPGQWLTTSAPLSKILTALTETLSASQLAPHAHFSSFLLYPTHLRLYTSCSLNSTSLSASQKTQCTLLVAGVVQESRVPPHV